MSNTMRLDYFTYARDGRFSIVEENAQSVVLRSSEEGHTIRLEMTVHELRTLMGLIRGFLGAYQDRPSPGPGLYL